VPARFSGTHGGEKGAGTPPPLRSAGIALTVNPVFTEELVMADLKKSV